MADMRVEDRAAIRGMVEEFWISRLSAEGKDPAIGRSVVERFEASIEEIADGLPPSGAASFRAAVEEERAMLLSEYGRDREATRMRLGLPSMENRGRPKNSRGRSLGDVAVETAVRATVWETVRSAFRLFR
jgi:hypothetical protein